MDKKDNHFSSLESRMVNATVTSIAPTAINMLLTGSSPVHGKARMDISELPKNKHISNFMVGHTVPVYIIGKSSNENNPIWYVSGRLACRDDNPWIQNKIKVGYDAVGTASRYVNDYAVVIDLDNGAECFLHREEIPEAGNSDIRNIVHIGDRITALITSVNEHALQIIVSVCAYIEERNNAARECASYDFDAGDELVTIESLSNSESDISESIRNDIRVLVIDDDRFLTDTLLHWLMSIGVKCSSQNVNILSIVHALESFLPTHILLDFDLNNRELELELWEILRRDTNISKIAIISSDVEHAHNEARINNWDFFLKPLDGYEIACWLNNKHNVDSELFTNNNQDDTDILWGPSAHERNVIRQANRFLAELCVFTGCYGAVWAKEEREGVYTIRAKHNISAHKLNSIESLYPISFFAQVIRSKQNMIVSREVNNALWSVVPESISYAYGMKLEAHGKIERSIVFFKKGKFRTEDIKYFEQQTSRMLDLIDRLELITTLREMLPFCTIGRISSGLIHELRNAISPINLRLMALKTEIANNKYENMKDVLIKNLKDIIDRTTKVEKLAKKDLGMIQRSRHEIIRVNSLVKSLLQAMSTTARHKKVSLHFVGTKQEITTNLPPECLEQPLTNLIDNAIYHTHKRSCGRVVVAIEVHPNDRLPLWIKVKDDGYGMSAEQKGNLFKPRFSSKGLHGIGMGSYLSRNLVRAVGGELDLVESFRWVGTEFLIRLPMIIKDMTRSS